MERMGCSMQLSPILHRWMRIPTGRRRSFDARTKFEKGMDFTTLLILSPDHEIIGCPASYRNAEVPSSRATGFTPHLGHGYVHRGRPCLDHNRVRIEIRMDGNNRPSWAGFEWEATLKMHRRDNTGQLSDTRVYAMFSTESVDYRLGVASVAAISSATNGRARASAAQPGAGPAHPPASRSSGTVIWYFGSLPASHQHAAAVDAFPIGPLSRGRAPAGPASLAAYGRLAAAWCWSNR